MVQADSIVTLRYKLPMGNLGLCEAQHWSRQRSFVDEPLMRLEPRHLRVAEKRKPL
jgi:hypothetical protein